MKANLNRRGPAQSLKSMLAVDFRRMFTMPMLYILVGACLAMPILILVMTTMMDGSITVDPQTGVETVIEGFDNVWQIIGSASGSGMTGMCLTGMCNINMLYFFVAALVCIFVADDFRSGYAKNLFAVRTKRSNYVISKTLTGFVGGALMLLAFFIGAMLGGAMAGLSFGLGAVSAGNVILCMLAKIFLVGAFVPVYLLWGVIAKQKLWLSLVGSLCTGMLFFMMVPMITPLDASFLNVILCLAGGALLGAGLGAVSNRVLNTTSLV